MNIWICPATRDNLKMMVSKNIWAFNANRKKSFDQMNIGDICLFGSLRKNEGFNYVGIVENKKILTEVEDNWPFKTPSGTFWKYSFTLKIYEINITPNQMRELRGFTNNKQGWQTQTLLTIGKENVMNYLKNNYSFLQ